MLQTNTLIIGASVSGLACAACLQKQKIPYLIIEKESAVAAPWRSHYERLHLHTHKNGSHLPYKKMDRHFPKYPSRQQVLDYLEHYQNTFNIQPLFNAAAKSVKKEADGWVTETSHQIIRSRNVIVATGLYNKPKPVCFPGQDSFTGTILHSAAYKTGNLFKNKKVLVVGFGNSACEIAIDLFEQGASPYMSVRSAVNVVPRDLLGIPILQFSLLMRQLPPRIADKLGAPLVNAAIGNIAKLGLRKKPYGPLEQIQKEGTVPLLDIGTIAHIKKGHIKILPGIDHIEPNTIHFTNGRKETFDAIIAAIGYDHNETSFLQASPGRFDDLRLPTKRQHYFGKDGLYFCGFWVSPFGQIREIGLDAQRIAAAIAAKSQ